MPLLHGIDIVEVARITRLREEHEARFLERCFTPAEVEYAKGASRRLDEHLAARFAAKEAVVKALGTGVSHGISWTDIEVTRSSAGKPGITLTGQAASIADKLGAKAWVLSLSHAGGMAIASVIAQADSAPE